jgi:hypothetical protein
VKKRIVPPLQVAEPATGKQAGSPKLAPAKGENYLPMYQGPGVNRLMKVSTRKTPPSKILLTEESKLVSEGITVFFDKTDSLPLSARKLLDILIIKFTAQNSQNGSQPPDLLIRIPLEEYMKLCGVPLTESSRDKARARVEEDLDDLYGISMQWSEEKNNKIKDFDKMRLCYRVGVIHGNIVAKITPEFGEYLLDCGIMLYSPALLKLSNRNPHAYLLGRKLLLHNSIDNNQLKGTADILSVKKLSKVLSELPTYDEVMRTDRAFGRRIREPFEKAMNDLLTGGVLERWEYCNSKRANLTEEQLNDFSYYEFERRYISFRLLNTPDHTPRLRAKAKRRKKKS